MYFSRIGTILNDNILCFKFTVEDDKFYLFLFFDRFNVSFYDVGYFLFV